MRPSFPSERPGAAPLAYELRLMGTQAATGYFMPVPLGEPAFDEVLDYLRHHPNDAFMHRYGLQIVQQMEPDLVRPQIRQASRDRLLMALLLEACLTHAPLAALQRLFPPGAVYACRNDSPLLILRSESLPDQERHRQWTAILGKNLLHHSPLAMAHDDWPAPLYDRPLPGDRVSLAEVAPPSPGREPLRMPSMETITTTALQRLEVLGILVEGEMRHEGSLSPIALLRRWRMAVSVDQDRHRFHFSGLQTAYGKGLSLERARASCAMEIVERLSAFATVSDGRLPDMALDLRLRQARRSELTCGQEASLDPNLLDLEVPYENQPLYWILGEQDGRDLLVPFQAVFLFANLDEICLFSGLGSTGLAAGWTLAQAKFHALLECIERDAEAVQPFDPNRCFRLTTQDAAVGGLLADYRRRGIDVVFQDCSNGLGIPCYKCFVYGPGAGQISKGASAHFAGWQAALAAMTETPYPYPHGPASRPGPQDLPLRYLEALPDLSSDGMEADLLRLEALLAANQLHPVYVNLTRRDLRLPVVRALVPGLALMADFDRYSRLNPRLYWNCRKLADDSGQIPNGAAPVEGLT